MIDVALENGAKLIYFIAFESIVDKIIIGGETEDGEKDPAMITIIYKTGKSDTMDGTEFKRPRKNAKNKEKNIDNKLCSQIS